MCCDSKKSLRRYGILPALLHAAVATHLHKWLELSGLLLTANGNALQVRWAKKAAKAQSGKIPAFHVGLTDSKALSLGVMKRCVGCQTQPAHADAGFGGAFIKEDPRDVGLALIVAVDATTIQVYPFDAPSFTTPPTPIKMYKGDLLLLRGDCGHQGDENPGRRDTIIIHGYLDSPVEGCQREFDDETGEALTFEFFGYEWQTEAGEAGSSM